MVFDEAIQARVMATGAVAVLVIDDVAAAVPVARALMEGGVDIMELTLRTPSALEALHAIKIQVPEMLAGVGTILTREQVQQSIDAGADFGVSPGLNRRIVERAIDRRLSFAPGVATPSDVETAIELGCRLIKFFPAEPLGGLPYLESMAAPYAHLGIRYIPLGGVYQANAGEYMKSPLIAAFGGSFIATRQQIREENWNAITQNARVAKELVQEARRG